MDKIVYQEGYNAAIEAIKQALQKQASGQNPQPNRQDQKNANKQGMDTSINPQGNGGELSKAAADKQNQQGTGQGSSNGGEINITPGQESDGGQGSSGGESGDGSGSSAGGSQSSGASREARKSEVSQLGGSFIDKELGEKIAKESGYDSEELGTDENLETKWSKIAQQVAAGAAAHGSGRGSGLLGIINSIYKPSKNWKAELKKFVGHAVGGLKTTNAWGRKSQLQYDEIRRYDRKENECLDQVVFMIDTSGSTHGDILMKLLSETHHIIEQKKIANVTYAYYGDGLVGTEVIKKPKDINPEKLKVRNGGGTNIGRSLDEMGQYMKDRKKGGHRAELLMIFTDGDLYNNYSEKPKWCKNAMFVICDCPGCPEPSWGKTLYIDASDVK